MAQRRIQAFIAFRAAGGKGTIEAFWPMGKQAGNPDRIVMDDAMKAQIMKAHNLVL